MPLSLFFYFGAYVVIDVFCAFIVLGLGNGFGWDGGKLLFHFLFNLSPILWSCIRIAAEPLFLKLKK